jgi:Tol biopolymer transport system component
MDANRANLSIRPNIGIFPMKILSTAIAFSLSAASGSPAPAQELAPDIFAPGVISGPANDLSPAFTPDGRTVFFTRSNSMQSTILVSHLKRGRWSKPEIASFSGEWRDLEPAMAPDGSYLIFASNRPATASGKPLDGYYNGGPQPAKGGNLWRVDGTPHGWSEARRLPEVVNANPSVFSPSLAADGSLYFMQPSGAQMRFHIFRAQLTHAVFSTPVGVSVSAAEGIGDFDPAVAPDESFMVFSSARIAANGTSLFIVFRKDGAWASPTYMGDVTSLPGANNIEARLGPNSRTLYFSSTRVVPTPQHDRAASRMELERMKAWNNGLANIWRVSLAPWLEKKLVMTIPETRLNLPPRVVGAGVISTPAEEFKATVSPDGQTLSYVVTDHLFRHTTIVQAERAGTQWSTPEVASFSGTWRDGDPSFAPDGKTLLFISNRPLPGDPDGTVRRDFNIWLVHRQTDGTWGDPVALERNINTDTSEFAPSVTAAGTLYFSRGEYIFRAEKRGSDFVTPVALPMKGGDPAISPDERFIVFDADGLVPGDADLFVSCRTQTGWAAPSRLADPVNSPYEEGDPSISADGHTLYFFSRRFTSAPDRAPRARRATYSEIQREALGNIFNGSRNLYEVDLSASLCAAPVH